jgi:hypothetical protein
MRNYAADSDGDFSVIIAPAPSVGEQTATVVTKVTEGSGDDAVTTTTTFIIDYTAVVFNVSGTVKASSTSTKTTTGLTVASALQQGSDVSITLAGTGISKSLPTDLSSSYPGAQDCAAITFDGILLNTETGRFQASNPALKQYVENLIQDNDSNKTYGTTPKTQADIESAYTAAPAKAYFWQTSNPVTYNKMAAYTSDGELSILLTPTAPSTDQKIKVIKRVTTGSAPNQITTTTTFNIDYSAATFAN